MAALPRTPSQEQLDAADLRGAELAGVRLRGLSLQGRDLSGAVLRFADLRGCSLQAAVLEGADLRDVDLGGANLTGARMARSRLERVQGQRVQLQGADLTEANLTGAVLPGAGLASARLDRAVARSARLEGANFEGASLRLVSARGAAFDRSVFDGALLDGADLRGATLEQVRGANATFAGAGLEGVRLHRSALEGADFTGARTGGLRAAGTPLTVAQTTALNAGGARVGPGWLRRGSGRVWTWVREGGLQGAARAAAARIAAAWTALRPKPKVVAEPGPVVPPPAPEPLALIPGADLRDKDLRGEDLRGVDLTGARLDGARMDGADLVGARLDGASLVRANLSGARLRGVSLRGADLSRASLGEAVLEGAVLEDARLEGALLDGARLQGAHLSGASFRDADLSDADFRGQALAGVDLRGARLDAADLRDVDLTGVVAQPVDLAGAMGVSPQKLRALRPSTGPGFFAAVAARVRGLADAPWVLATEQRIARGLNSVATWLREGGLRRVAQRLRAAIPARPAWLGALNPLRAATRLLRATGDVVSALAAAGAGLAAAAAARVIFRDEAARAAPLTRSACVPGVDLSGRDLRGLDLEGVDLTGANLQRARLDGMNLTGIVLERADLSGARLTRAVFTGARLAGANFTRAVADDAVFDGADLQGTDFGKASVVGASLKARLQGASFVGAAMGATDLAGVDLTGVDLSRARLDQADLTDARFEDAVVIDADVAGALGLSSRARGGLSEQGARAGNVWLAQLAAAWEVAQPLQRIEALVTRGLGLVSAWVRGGGPTRVLRLVTTPLQAAQLAVRRYAPLFLAGLLGLAALPARLGFALVADIRQRRRAHVEQRRARQAALQADLRPGADLSGRDLRKLDVAGLDLSGADLRRVRLDGADLTGTVLIGANLSGARMSRATLRQTDLSGAWLDAARLDGADIRDSDLSAIEGEQLRMSGARLHGVQLTGAVLQRADLSSIRCEGVDFDNADLSGARLDHAALETATFVGAEVAGASFVKARGLDEERIEDLHARGAAGLEGRIRPPEPVIPGPGVDLQGEDLRGMDLSGRDLQGADFTGARLEGAVLERANLEGAVLDGARLRAARLEGARMASASLVGASLDDARMSGADLQGADLSGASLVGAGLGRARLAGARLVDADLSAAVLADADLSGADLSGGQFDQAELVGALLDEAVVTGADFEGALGLGDVVRRELAERGAAAGLLELPRFDFKPGRLLARITALFAFSAAQGPGEEDLLPGAELRGLDLRHMDLRGIDLRGADLRAARLDGLDLSGTLLCDARLDGARLTRATLVGADLRNASAAAARFEDARLDDAQLEGLKAPKARFRGARFSGALRGLSLVEADLRDASFQGCQLTEVDLSRARVTRCDFEDATLDDCVVEGTDLSSALGVAAELLSVVEVVPVERVPLRTRLSGLLGAPREAFDESVLVPGAALAGMDLRRAKLAGLDLSGANLRGCRLEGLDLRGTVLAGAVLDGANLSRTRLAEADLTRARAEQTLFDDARMDGAILVGLHAPRASLVGASLDRADLSRAVLTEADLSAASLEQTVLTAADLSGAQLDQAVLSDAVLDEVVLTGTDLEGVLGLSATERTALEGRGADLGGINLRPAVEKGLQAGAELASATGAFARRLAAAIPRRDVFDSSRLVPGVSLAGEDLRRVALAGLDLRGANLSGCRLDGVDLRGTRLDGAVLDRANLSRARLSKASLVGASALGTRFDAADLKGATLDGLQAGRASFVDADVRQVSLTGAVLAGADLSAATLADLDLLDADLRGARFEQTDLAGARLGGCAVDEAQLTGALGLSLEQREALAARGADAGGLPSLGRLVTTSRAAQLLAAALLLTVFGYALSELADQETQVAVVAEDEGVDAVLARYEAELADTTLAGDRVVLRYEMASLLERDGRLEEAEETLLAALDDAEDEDAVEVRVRLGTLRSLLGDFEGAEAIWTEALDSVGAPPALAAQALLGLIDLRADAQGQRAARSFEADWRSALEHNPGRVVDISVLAAAGRVASGEYEEALALLEPLQDMALAPDERSELLAALAELHVARGDLGQADSLYTALLEQPGESLDRGRVLLAAATVSWKRGDVPVTLARLDELDRRGTHPRVAAQALLLRARAVRDSDPELAVALYQQVMADHSDDRDALGAAQLGLAETLGPEAQRSMANELLGDGDDTQAGWMLLSAARRLRATGDPEGARALYDEVIGLNASVDITQAAWRDLAELEIGLGDVDAGIKALRAIQAELEGLERVEVQARIADALLSAGRLQNAEEAYQTLVDGYPEGSEAAIRGQLGLAVVAEARGEMEQARAGYQRIIETTSSPTVAGEAQAALAGNLLESGEPDRALAAWRAFLATLPEGHEAAFDARLAVAEILRGRGEREAALAEYSLLLDTATTPVLRTRVRLAVAELLEEAGRHDEASEAYIALLDDPLTPDDEQDYVLVGLVRSTLSLGDADGALVWARSRELTDPGSVRLMTQLEVQALRALGRDDEADAYGLEVAAEEEDDTLSLAMNDANALLNEWDFEGAIAAYEALLETVEDRPTAAAIETSIAQAMALSGDIDGARSHYGRVLRVYRDDPEAVFGADMGLAWLLRTEGDPEAAIERYERLVPPDPGSAVWRDEQLARAFVEAGRPEDAEALYKSMLQEHAGDRQAEASARSGLAEVLQANDELRAARALYQWVAEHAPDPTQRSWAALHAAMLLVDEGQLDQAEEALDELLDHEDPELRLQAAVGLSAIELERGRPRRALDVLDEVDPEALGGAWVATWTSQRTSCLLELGRPDEAIEAWTGVLERWTDNDDVASQARLALGDLALGQDRPDDAADWYNEVLNGSPDRHYQARALLGLVHLGQDDACARLMDDFADQHELTRVAAVHCEDSR